MQVKAPDSKPLLWHAGTCPEFAEPDDKRPSQKKEVSKGHGGHHRRKGKPRPAEARGAVDGPGLSAVWVDQEVGRCLAAPSRSPAVFHRHRSDTNLRQRPITSQQISRRHAIAINLGATLSAGWGIPVSGSRTLPQMLLKASSQRPI